MGVHRVRDRLAITNELGATVLICSTMPRAVETAAIIAPALGLPVALAPEMCEHDPGDCDGMSFDSYVERFGGDAHWDDLDADIFPGGETVRTFQGRVRAGLDTIVETHRDQSIVIACHAGVIDTSLRYLLGTARAGGFQIRTINTSITELSREGEHWVMHRYNDSAHLFGLPKETGGEHGPA